MSMLLSITENTDYDNLCQLLLSLSYVMRWNCEGKYDVVWYPYFPSYHTRNTEKKDLEETNAIATTATNSNFNTNTKVTD